MATVTKAASSNAVVTTGWTNPTNAYASDNVYATAAPAKNATVNSDFGFSFALSDFAGADTAAQVVIDQIVLTVEWKLSVTTSATLGAQLYNNGAAQGTEVTDTTSTTDTNKTQTITSGVTASDLIAGNLKARVRDSRGNTNTAHTGSLDYVKVDVTYHIVKDIRPTARGYVATVNAASNNWSQTVTVSPSTTYTMSFYAKSGTAADAKYSIYDLTHAADIVGLTSYISQINGTSYSRVSFTFTTPAGCTSINAYLERDNNATGTIYLAMAQLESGSSATSWQATGASAGSKNLFLWSEALDTSPWGVFGGGTSVTIAVDSGAGPTDGMVLATSSMTASLTKTGGATDQITPGTVSATSAVTASLSRTRSVATSTVNATSAVGSTLVPSTSLTPSTSLYPGSGSVTIGKAAGGGSTKSVTPATVNATSSVSATVRRFAAVKPATVSSTSSVTARVNAIKAVSATVAATSSVSAALHAVRRVAPATINSTSTVTASVVRLAAVRPATLTASSNVTATVGVAGRKAVVPVTVAATSTVTASVRRYAAIPVAAVTATSTVTTSVARLLALSSIALTATSSITGALRSGRFLIALAADSGAMAAVAAGAGTMDPTTGALYPSLTLYPGTSLDPGTSDSTLAAASSSSATLAAAPTSTGSLSPT